VLRYLGCWWAWYLSWMPDALRYLLHYHENVLYFHELAAAER
jgi:hypothetical protein